MVTPPDHEVPTEYQDSTQQPREGAAEAPQRHQPGLGSEQGPPRDMEAGEGNLLELPDGATFGAEQQPSAPERERLLRRAAQTEQELQERTEQRPQS